MSQRSRQGELAASHKDVTAPLYTRSPNSLPLSAKHQSSLQGRSGSNQWARPPHISASTTHWSSGNVRIHTTKSRQQPFHSERNRIQALTNPLCALKGLGCTLCSTQCLTLSNLATRFPAGSPHARNTTPLVLLLATISITFCVNLSQP